MQRKSAGEFDQKVLDLYDDFAHGRIDRREFVQRVALLVGAGVAAEATVSALLPNYAWAQQVSPEDSRIVTSKAEYQSPQGGGKIRGLMAYPSDSNKNKHPAVLVIHENRGLNPYIEDVTRRLAVAGFLAFAPDALTPLGGYPGNDDEGRTMQAKRSSEEMTQDFIAAAKFLDDHSKSTGKVGAVGFCFGGGMVNQLAVLIPETIDAAVPFYGRQPATEDVSKIKAPLMIHYGELDSRINEGWPAFEKALAANNKVFEVFIYSQANHGFHNDSTPRYDEQAAKLAWERTVAFFNKYLT